MKATASGINPIVVVERTWVAVWCDLVKARLTLLVLLTTLVGLRMGTVGPLDWVFVCHILFATGLLAGGAAALNQYVERDLDGRMYRTQERPLPSGRLCPATALWFGLIASVAGLAYLFLAAGAQAAWVGGLTLGVYVGVYTPLKRVTPWNTVVGAVPGALPPLLGWTAAQSEIGAGGLALFALQFFWQIPHFLAIAWLYREDYERAGFRMLPVVDPAGTRTRRHVLVGSLGLLLTSLTPFLAGLAGPIYAVGAAGFSGAFLGLTVWFLRRLDAAAARGLFLGSILYLPLLLGLMVLDKAN